MAASCGLIYGYDNGVSGGVTQMESFLSDFFPEVLTGTKDTNRSIYCKYDNQWLTTFTSSLFIASALSSIVASHVTRKVGRQAIMLFGSALFLAGAVINAAAVNLTMIIVGRMLLGFGIGFTFQSAPVYHSETAPAKWRGAFASAYNAFSVMGTLSATVTNYFTDEIPGWGWRVSLGLAGVPGTLLAVGALFVSDTPSSLVLRGHTDKARAALRRIRGANADVDGELKDIVGAVEAASRNDDGAFRRLFSKEYRQYLVVGVALPVFYELTGVSVISVFLPVVFRTVGFSSQKAILGAVINFSVNLVATLLSSFVMDRTGRRFLLVAGGLCATVCQVAISLIMAAHLGAIAAMPHNYATGVLVMLLLCTFSFSASWAPVRWAVTSEIYPVEVRSAGQAMSISIWLCLTFTELQVFIKMLCTMKYGVLLFHAGWLLVGIIFVAVFLPETKGVPLEVMRSVWIRHWYWRKFAEEDMIYSQDTTNSNL
ncbi:hypothetical protein HU200_015830 [Digitaria exilis]|uniref:Major facilitator superfamily (MFS) profile domain-containing protein n=1 Tax=Digitaria exilis TaxID=1010633 RepID=A0A835F9A3_9POAL|nr:hypothetical protein HU200_015830 [Digitaria exilis]